MAGRTPALTAEIWQLDWQPVVSSNLAAVAYSPDFARMYIRFISGDVYAYLDIPESVYQGLLAAGSKGKYLHRHVKGAFGYVKVR